MVNPGGTGSFSRDISARFAPLPPSSAFRSARPSVFPAPNASPARPPRGLAGRRAGRIGAFAWGLAITLLSVPLPGRLPAPGRGDPLAQLRDPPVLGAAGLGP